MTSGSPSQRFGRVVIDEDGIVQRPVLFFFGAPFRLHWSEITAWAVSDQVSRIVKTGAERVDRRILELHVEGKGSEVVSTIFDLGNRLQLAVVAEGIESGDQLKLLRTLKCRLGQGFSFSKPLRASQAITLIN